MRFFRFIVPMPQPLVKYVTLQKKRTSFPEHLSLAFLVFTDEIEEGRLYDMHTILSKMSVGSGITI